MKAKRTASKQKHTAPEKAGAAGAERARLYLAVAAIAVGVIACYANGLSGEFVFDDEDLVLRQKLLRSLSNLPLLIGSYRPLRNATYALDFAVWGPQPFGFHVTSVLLHIGSAVLVFALIRKLIGGLLPAAVAALIFAVHPMQTDSVTYISGRRDVLFGLLYIGSFYAYLRYRESRRLKHLVLFFLLWVMSLLSKEMAASMLAFVFVWNFCNADDGETGSRWNRLPRRALRTLVRDKWLYVALLLVTAAYTVYSVLVKHASTRVSESGAEYWGGSVSANALTVMRVHAWYLKQLVWPTPIAQYFGAFEPSRSLFEWRVVLSIIVVGAVIAAGILLLKKEKLMSFAILSYFVLLLPVSHIIPHHELLADHYLYLPLMSFGLLMALLLKKASGKSAAVRKAAYAVSLMAVLALGALTVVRNRDWQNGFAVWQSNYDAVPNSPRAAYNLAGQYLSRNIKKAEELYLKALEIDPTYAPTYVKLTQLYVGQNRTDEIEQIVQRGLSISDAQIKSTAARDPAKFRSQLNLALAAIKGKRGDQQEEERLLLEAIQLSPTNMEAYDMLARRYRDDTDLQIDVYRRAVAAKPTLEMLEHLAALLMDQRKYDEAESFLRRALDIVPSDFYANYQMIKILEVRDDCGGAMARLAAARSAASDSEERKAVAEADRRIARRCGKQ
ncbi:MAG TPA: tetratricopeptide repeat protein [Blastocatellia bacterium]|nr:tetratricopeptide repeat protein [Blastocatellia bacterium]